MAWFNLWWFQEQRSNLVVSLCNVEDSVPDSCLSAPQWFHVYSNMVWRNNKILYCFSLGILSVLASQVSYLAEQLWFGLPWKGLGDCAYYCAEQSLWETSITSLGFQFCSCKFWFINWICWIFNDLTDHLPFSVWSYLVFCDWHSTIYCSNPMGAMGKHGRNSSVFIWLLSFPDLDAFLYLQWA